LRGPRRSGEGAATATAPPPTLDAEALVAERCAWSLVWIGVISGGLSTWGMWTASSALTVLGPLLILVATTGIVATWVSASPRSRNLQLLALTAAVASVVVSEYGSIHARRFYMTDSAAFDHRAAWVLVHGQNPYAVSMAPAASMLDIASHYWTYTVAGGHVTTVSYPAGSFLLVAPAMLLGFQHQIVDWMDLLAWLVTGVLLFALMPVALRWLAALLVITPLFVGIFSGGGTDALYLPFLVLAVWRWDRYGQGRSAGVAGWIGPVALGLACAVKQSPWFCVPFLVAGVAIEARRSGLRPGTVAVRYAGTVLAVFAVVNLPFIVWGPGAWLHGTITPIVQPLVADGQGLVSLAVHGVLPGADLTYLTVSGVLVYLTALIVFVVAYPRLKRVWLVVIPLSMFVSPRSLSSYLIDFLPVALLAAFTVSAGSSDRRPAASGRVAARRVLSLPVALCVVPALGAVAFAALAFAGPPLQLTVDGVRTGDGGITMSAVTLSVRNLTGSPEVPHVVVTMGQHPAGFWLPRGGLMAPVPAHGEVTLTLYPPSATYTALRGVEWVVSAYTTSPKAISTSAVQVGSRPPSPF